MLNLSRFFGAAIPAQYGVVSGGQGGFVDVKLVRIHRALNHGLAEPEGGCNENRIPEAGFGIEREGDAAGAQV
jgi:hypothetical protein